MEDFELYRSQICFSCELVVNQLPLIIAIISVCSKFLGSFEMSFCNDERGKAKEMTDLSAELAFTVVRKGMQERQSSVSFYYLILNQAQLHAIVWSSNLLKLIMPCVITPQADHPNCVLWHFQSGCQFQATVNATKTQNMPLKTYSN